MSGPTDAFARDVAAALQRTPRQLPSKYLYDPLGSALFDAICRLPWYRITRAEQGLLDAHAADMLAPVADRFAVAELGCGSGEKLAVLIGGAPAGCRSVHLIDISAEALDRARHRIAPLVGGRVHVCRTSYEDGLRRIAAQRAADIPLVLAFLGSNIGNFDPPAARALLADARSALAPGDLFLLGTDLVKPEADLLLAYDDPLQVTAAFNLNLLRRINDELGGMFDLRAFAHRAVWNAGESRVEMHLVSRTRQTVRVAGIALELTFDAGEMIWTESSYKYRASAVIEHGRSVGFSDATQWIDADAGFALTRFSV